LVIASLMTGLMMMGVSTTRQAEGSTILMAIEQRPVYYSTSGTIGVPGGDPVDFLDFVGVSSPSGASAPSGVFYMPGTFSLGAFQARGLPSGTRRVFDDMPFSITLNLFDQPFVGTVASQIRVEGQLDGELSTGPGLGLLASVRSVTRVGTPLGTPPFRLEDLQILAPQFILPAGPSPVASSPIYAYVSAQVPEPTALATLGLGAAAFLAHRARRRRTRSKGGVTC
jgi:hypothetical protein